MAETQPKHKPNEKHTLDEVLKSLKDLVGSEVLDKPSAPAAPSAASTRPVPPPEDMRDVISALEGLLDSDLSDEDKPKKPAPTLRAQPDEPKTPPAAAVAAPRGPHRPQPPAIEPEFHPTFEVVEPAPPQTPLIETTDKLEFDSPAQSASTPAPSFPDELSDEDIAKALAEIELEMGIEAAPAPAVEFGSEVTVASPESEPESVAEVVAPEPVAATPQEADRAPPLELTAPETSGETQPATQQELTFGSVLELQPGDDAGTAPPPDDSGLEVIEDEIAAAPAPEEPPPEVEETEDFELIDLSPSPEESPTPNRQEPILDEDLTIDFSPRKPDVPASLPEPEDLAPPPWQEEDGDLQRAEPPMPSDDVSFGQLGESIELDVGVTPFQASDSLAELEPLATESAPLEELPIPTTDVIEKKDEPRAHADDVSFEQLGESIELDASVTPAETSGHVIEFKPAAEKKPAPPSPATAAPPPVQEPAIPKTETIEFTAPSEPPAAPESPAKEIPVLKNVAVERQPPAAPPPAEAFALDFAPATPPKPAAHDLHQMTVRVIAKLNIELRKGGKPPLDAKTINRLQQLLREALQK